LRCRSENMICAAPYARTVPEGPQRRQTEGRRFGYAIWLEAGRRPLKIRREELEGGLIGAIWRA